MEKVLRSREQKILQVMLRQARERTGINQENFAAVIDEPQSFITKYETGKRMLRVIELIAILRALNVSPSEFIEELDEKIGPEISILPPK